MTQSSFAGRPARLDRLGFPVLLLTACAAACDREPPATTSRPAGEEPAAAAKNEPAKSAGNDAKRPPADAEIAPPPPPDTTPPVVRFTAMDGASLGDPVVTQADTLLFMAHATDDRAVVSATQRVNAPGRTGAAEPVSTIALRGGTSVEIPLAEVGEHVLELEVRDAAGNATVGRLVVEKRAHR